MQKIAIMGGTFNPVHWGHLLMAETALNQIALDRVIWVPTYRPLYKATSELLSFHHRLEMVRRAIEPHPQFAIAPVEQDAVKRSALDSSYAVDTLLNLQLRYPHSQWYWIIGLDAFQSLPRWYRHQELIRQCDWLVAPRLGSEATEIERTVRKMAAESVELRWQLLHMPLIDISSSLIRHYCGKRHSIRYLVPESVRDYILEHELYGATRLN
jgi:nicotinate-nucleotide adenylyltransferase